MTETIKAAGVVLLRKAGQGGHEVAVIHRPHRQDWTLPKGKVDPGESLPQTAVREVAEETGLAVTLGVPLSSQHYNVGDAPKTVHYWRSNTVAGAFTPNAEADELRWLAPESVKALLTYEHDRALVDEACAAPDTVPLLLVRHAHAGDRDTWLAAGRADSERPLSERGLRAVPAVAAIARAYGVRHVITSPAARCTQTVAGLRAFAAWQESPWVQDGADIGSDGFEQVLATLADTREPAALCTHGEQVDWLVSHFGQAPRAFSKGGVLVVHRRAEDLGMVVATEWYPPPR
ncbi:MAG: NUDIX hydrolase [Actinomycetales bacterium]|nr:NUDIX hydrolase [Actinomycetales bacterium]